MRFLLARPRLLACVALGLATAWLLPDRYAERALTRAIIGWNVGACIYLVLAAQMMFGSSHERMCRRAEQHDEGRLLVLTFVVFAALMCVAAIVAELAAVRELKGEARYMHLGLTVLTLLTSWAFTQVMFAQHYAHDYYVALARRQHGGLEFPGGQAPDYGDFLYFSCIIGTSAQTADVSLASRQMRRTGLLHCVLAFFFNTTLLALTINIASGLF